MAPTLPRFCFHLAEQDNWPFIQLAVGALVPDTLGLKRAACTFARDHPLLDPEQCHFAGRRGRFTLEFIGLRQWSAAVQK